MSIAPKIARAELESKGETGFVPDLLMWVGGRYYTIQSFIEEARRLGVTRRISTRAIPKYAVFGRTRVFLVSELDENDPNIVIKKVNHKNDLDKLKRIRTFKWEPKVPGYRPIPKVFGYFTLAGIFVVGENKKDVEERFRKAGLEVHAIPSSSGVLSDIRGCGRMVYGAVYITDRTFELRLLAEQGLQIGFIEGSLTVIDPPIPAEGLERFRGWRYVVGDAILQRKPVDEWFNFPEEFLLRIEAEKSERRKQRRAAKKKSGNQLS